MSEGIITEHQPHGKWDVFFTDTQMETLPNWGSFRGLFYVKGIRTLISLLDIKAKNRHLYGIEQITYTPSVAS